MRPPNTLRHFAHLGRRLTVTISAVVVALTTAGLAQAADYPSQHWAYAQCYRTSLTSTWTVMSGVYMNRADGYPHTVYGTAIGTGAYFTGGTWTVIDSNSQQRLYHQVAVASWNSNRRAWDWTYGTWLRGWDYLGDGTSGLDSEVWDASRGMWIKTGYTGAGSPWDASYANGVLTGGIALQAGVKKYVYAHYIWGPIYNAAGQQSFKQYENYELLGSLDC
jgi:hypothetical protein